MSLVNSRCDELRLKGQPPDNHKIACQLLRDSLNMVCKKWDTELTREQDCDYWMDMVQLYRAMNQLQTSKAIADMAPYADGGLMWYVVPVVPVMPHHGCICNPHPRRWRLCMTPTTFIVHAPGVG